MQVIFIGRLVILPYGTAEEGFPVVGLTAVPGRTPDIEVAVRVVLALAAFDEPGMLVGTVVDHQIHDQPDAARMHPSQQLFPVGQSAELVHDVLVVADIVCRLLLEKNSTQRASSACATPGGQL